MALAYSKMQMAVFKLGKSAGSMITFHHFYTSPDLVLKDLGEKLMKLICRTLMHIDVVRLHEIENMSQSNKQFNKILRCVTTLGQNM